MRCGSRVHEVRLVLGQAPRVRKVRQGGCVRGRLLPRPEPRRGNPRLIVVAVTRRPRPGELTEGEQEAFGGIADGLYNAEALMLPRDWRCPWPMGCLGLCEAFAWMRCATYDRIVTDQLLRNQTRQATPRLAVEQSPFGDIAFVRAPCGCGDDAFAGSGASRGTVRCGAPRHPSRLGGGRHLGAAPSHT